MRCGVCALRCLFLSPIVATPGKQTDADRFAVTWSLSWIVVMFSKPAESCCIHSGAEGVLEAVVSCEWLSQLSEITFLSFPCQHKYLSMLSEVLPIVCKRRGKMREGKSHRKRKIKVLKWLSVSRTSVGYLPITRAAQMPSGPVCVFLTPLGAVWLIERCSRRPVMTAHSPPWETSSGASSDRAAAWNSSDERQTQTSIMLRLLPVTCFLALKVFVLC